MVRRPSEERAQVYAFGWNAQRATAASQAAAAILSNPSSTRRGCYFETTVTVAALATEAELRCLLHGSQHFLFGGQQFALLGHHLAVHGYRELAVVSVNHLHINSRLLPQRRRQTGGVRPNRASDRALPNYHLLHRGRSFPNPLTVRSMNRFNGS